MAARVGISSLPAEVLRKVFECGLEDQPSSTSVASFLRVCRQWKDVAEPVLYSKICIRTGRGLKSLVSAVHWALAHERFPMMYTRRVEVSSPPGFWALLPPSFQDAGVQHDIATVLMHCKRLEVLDVTQLGSLKATTVMMASQACSASLRRLDIQLNVSTLINTCVYLRGFSQLRDLRVILVGVSMRASEGKLAIDNAFSWDMPFLSTLTFHVQAQHHSDLAMTFLHACRFPALRNLGIALRSPYAVETLAEFLGDLALDSLSFRGEVDEQSQARVIPHLRAKSLSLSTSALGPAFADHLSPSVHGLHMMHSPGDFGEFWAFLDHLVLRHNQLGIRNIFMSEWPISRWIEDRSSPESEADPPNMCRLLRYAAALSQCGINFRDNHGKTVTEYFA